MLLEPRRAALVAGMAWILMVTSGGVARAADGDLDTSFGGDGKVTTRFPIGAYARAVAIQPDGKIVAAGAAAGASEMGEFALARYETDGSLDTTFGVNGRVTTAISAGGGDEARTVAIQPDGKIVAAGTNLRRFEVVRYDSDGSLDPTFGNGGIVRTNLTPGRDMANDLVVQPNGRIVAVGSAGDSPVFALVRYTPDGSLDPTFGGDGTVLTEYGIWGVASAAVLQPDGRIVAVGFNGWGFALARYRRNGNLDPSFGADGKVGNSFRLGWAGAVALQPDGKIVAAGDRDIFHFAVARYTTHGRLDPTFSRDGRLTTEVGGEEQGVMGLVIQPSGKIVAAGGSGPHEYGSPTPWRFVLMRYRANGVVDPAFGNDGKVITRFPNGAFAWGAAAQPDGRIVVVGGAGESNREAFALARYLL